MIRCAYELTASRRRCPQPATRGRWCDTHHRLMTMHAKPTACPKCDGTEWDGDPRIVAMLARSGALREANAVLDGEPCCPEPADHTEDT